MGTALKQVNSVGGVYPYLAHPSWPGSNTHSSGDNRQASGGIPDGHLLRVTFAFSSSVRIH